MKNKFLLNKSDIDKIYDIEELINKRIEYIYETLIEIYKMNRKTCSYEYKKSEFLNYLGENIPLIITCSRPMICVLNPYGYFDFRYGFPPHWLWENFEQEVKDGILIYQKLLKDPEANLLDILGKREQNNALSD